MLDVIGRTALERAFATVRQERIQALLIATAGPLLDQRAEVVQFAAKEKLPAVYGRHEYVVAGGLMSYGFDVPEMYRRSATYVDRILRGESPGDLPVQAPTKFELIINLKAAKQIGLTIPPNVLARAEKVIR